VARVATKYAFEFAKMRKTLVEYLTLGREGWAGLLAHQCAGRQTDKCAGLLTD
jgi:hypothetical protein